MKIQSIGSLKINFQMIVRLVLTLILVLVVIICELFTEFVKMRQEVYAHGSRLEVEYRRRGNLMPNLTDIAKDYTKYELELMSYIADVRVLKKSYDKFKGTLDSEKRAQVEKVLLKLTIMAEQYPDLKAEQSYQALMAKNVRTENRVARAREKYADLIGEYNNKVKTFPFIWFARLHSFDKADQYMPDKQPMPEKNNRIYFSY